MLTDEAGYLAHAGLLTARPVGRPGCPARLPGQRDSVVELAVRLAELPVATGGYPGWAPVLAELVRQATEHQAEHAAAEMPRTSDPTRRLPASSVDLDYTHDHATGGPTTAANLGVLCRHHHRLKHEGGWRLEQPEPGRFVWTSRLGQRYEVRQPPVIEALTEPVRRAEPLPPVEVPHDHGAEWPIFENSEPERGPPPVP